MKAYTDYPRFTGDKPNIHSCEVVAWDHDKYCLLSDGRLVKTGYVYRGRRPVFMMRETWLRRFPEPLDYGSLPDADD